MNATNAPTRDGIRAVAASTTCDDDVEAATDLARRLAHADAEAVLLYCSADRDLPRLAAAVEDAFGSTPVFGCTTAGNINADGFTHHGVQALAIGGDSLSVRVDLITPLDRCQAIIADLGQRITADPPAPGHRRVGLLLIDGLAKMEERVTAALHHCLPGVQIVGGSAGDDLSFTGTHVYAHGAFHSNAAVLATIETDAPHEVVKLQHFTPTDATLVVTRATSATRTVHEFNGRPAAEAYAEALGLHVDQLDPTVFGRHPVMLRAAGEYNVRSIQQVLPDGSLAFYCAITNGLVLRIGRAHSPLEAIEAGLGGLSITPEIVLGFDCILRRLEFEDTDTAAAVSQAYRDHRVFGFSTYGEQLGALHMNQTFTGLALGSTS